jgi:large subunit ribosomal protein L5
MAKDKGEPKDAGAKEKGGPPKEKAPAKEKPPAKDKGAGKEKAEKGAPKGAGDGRPKGPAVEPRLIGRYKKEIVPELAKRFGRTNPMSLPKLTKISVNMGVGKALQDKNRLQEAVGDLAKITGQKPQITKSRIAVSGFRLRENQEIGCRVTLRKQRMYEFLDRLISVALPRIRDFRGVNPKSFDGHGNYTFGLSEQLVFPEIDADKVTFSQGMDVTICTSTDNDDEARELLRLFGMPFREA